MKQILPAVGLVIAFLCVIVALAVFKSREPSPEIVQLEIKPAPVVKPQTATTSTPAETAPAEKAATAPEPLQPAAASNEVNAASQPVVKFNAGQPAQANGLGDPQARDALALVGADPDAEAYWISAINNPDLPSNERRELIEDLNEDGISDQKNPTAEDLPLIVNRLQLLEQLEAMDDVNAAAFDEAYKDLANMYNRLAQN